MMNLLKGLLVGLAFSLAGTAGAYAAASCGENTGAAATGEPIVIAGSLITLIGGTFKCLRERLRGFLGQGAARPRAVAVYPLLRRTALWRRVR